MDPKLYKTIKSGDINGLRQILSADDHDRDLLLHQTTPLKSTILHVAVQFKSSCFEEIYNRCPSLLIQANLNGDTPLHIAARLGFRDAVSFFTNPSKIIYNIDIENNGGGGGVITGAVDNDTSLTPVQKLVRMENKKNDTALHEAVRNDEFQLVKMLTEADPSFEYFANDAAETPLYLAIERAFSDCFKQILDTCPSSAHGGPFGRTVLHNLAMHYNTSVIISYLLEKKPSIIKEVDDFGLTALHYAAYYGHGDQVGKLLEADPSVAYMADKAGKTALHYAARSSYSGTVEVIEQLFECCPDCWEQLDNNGRNFLHVAAQSANDAAFEHFMISNNNRQISNNGILMENLINQPDINGDTPLHLATNSDRYGRTSDIICKCNIVDKLATNKDNLTALDLLDPLVDHKYKHLFRLGARSGWRLKHIHEAGGDMSSVIDRNYKEVQTDEKITSTVSMLSMKAGRRHKEVEGIRKVNETHILVATLIATVTFAAGFTLPGGYNSDRPHKGMAVLARKPAFIAFLISNSTAMLLSTFTIFVLLCSKVFESVLDLEPDTHRKHRVMDNLFGVAILCTLGAIIAMVVAFVTGTYSVLLHLPGLAIPLCIFGCSFFIFCLLLLVKIIIWGFNPNDQEDPWIIYRL